MVQWLYDIISLTHPTARTGLSRRHRRIAETFASSLRSVISTLAKTASIGPCRAISTLYKVNLFESATEGRASGLAPERLDRPFAVDSWIWNSLACC